MRRPIHTIELVHIVPAPEGVTGNLVRFYLGQQPVEVQFVENISVARILPTPLGEGERFPGTERLRKLKKLVVLKFVRMPIVEVEAGLVIHIFHCGKFSVEVSDGNQSMDGIELIADRLAPFQVTQRESAFIAREAK